jgi:hypothetical protein
MTLKTFNEPTRDGPAPSDPVGTQLHELVQKGYDLLDASRDAEACDAWLEAWEMVKHTATPEMRSVEAFDAAHPSILQGASNWTSDLEMNLHNAGLRNPVYHEHRIRFAREYRARFPEMDDLCLLNLMRAEGEALWELGRRVESEAVYQELIARLPDQGWAYIGWSDHYHWARGGAVDYTRVETLLLQALQRPNLEDRIDVLDRLVGLYTAMDRPDKVVPLYGEMDRLRGQKGAQSREMMQALEQMAMPTIGPQGQVKLSRNDPCWCGSGKKYKRCHMRSDRDRGRGP